MRAVSEVLAVHRRGKRGVACDIGQLFAVGLAAQPAAAVCPGKQRQRHLPSNWELNPPEEARDTLELAPLTQAMTSMLERPASRIHPAARVPRQCGPRTQDAGGHPEVDAAISAAAAAHLRRIPRRARRSARRHGATGETTALHVAAGARGAMGRRKSASRACARGCRQ